ncbi:MAG: outer membrane protein assembly factor BamE [Candidatus Thiosymbion ectosymbiont of Robbea hypermnestra]|nr:outer membrane protein assembly factor BamE [Candidatus Thiosymbion ectosymbiont of Robbea hypermnestra]
MKRVLAYLVIGATLVLAGCSVDKKHPQAGTSVLEKLPFVHKMTIEQGNVVTEEMVDRLQPGMTKSQVRFLLGTPMLIDLFHTNRWDYTYTLRRGHDEPVITRLTLLFDHEDYLVRIQGDLQPDLDRAAQRQPKDLLVSVPDWQDNRGFLPRVLGKLNVESVE